MLASYERGPLVSPASARPQALALTIRLTVQIKRAQTVKSQYMKSEAARLKEKKEEAEIKAAPTGIMGLNLIALKDEPVESQSVKQPTADDKAGAKAPKESKQQAS